MKTSKQHKTRWGLGLLLSLFLLTAPAHAQKALFEKWDAKKGVTVVYVSKNLLRFADPVGSKTGLKADVTKKIDQLRILSTEDKKTAATIQAEALSLFRKGKYEETLKISEANKHVVINQRNLGHGRTEFALIVNENGTLNVINVEGKLTLSDIQSLR